MTPRAKEIANTILHMCDTSTYKTLAGLCIDSIVDEVGSKTDVKSVIRGYLVPMNYIKENTQTRGYYYITELGKNHIRGSTGKTDMSFGDNTNFAYNSPNAQQNINIDISIYNQDVQDKIGELQDAASNNDKTKFKSAMVYILDKGVDIVIAVALAQADIAK